MVIAGAILLGVSLRVPLRPRGGGALQAELASARLVTGQRHQLPAGPVMMSAEGRTFSRDFAGLAYGLYRLSGGKRIPDHPLMFRIERSGRSTTRLVFANVSLVIPDLLSRRYPRRRCPEIQV